MNPSMTSQTAAQVSQFIGTIVADALRPDPVLSVWEWADEFRRLSQKSSAQTGKYRTSKTPYWREVMECLSSHSPVRRVVVRKPAQVGFTEVLNNWTGYIIDHAPGPTLLVQPTVDMCKRYSKQRIAPMIEDTPVLRAKVTEMKSRDSGNTILEKDFAGGVLVMAGANSSTGLRSMPARYLGLDEVDAYPHDVDEEGDPIDLAVARTLTFSSSHKILMGSTPTVTGRSRIDTAFDETDRRFYHVPCVFCGVMAALQFSQLRWPTGKPHSAEYECPSCTRMMQNYHKDEILPLGAWVPTAECEPTTRGYAINGLYSPVGWMSWGDIAEKAEKAKVSTARMQVFVNTVQGESYAMAGETPDAHRLYERRENYAIGRVPMGGLFLTGAADVQADRIEIEIVAWGRGKQSWSVDYIVLQGSTKDDAIWAELTKVFESSWPSECGPEMRLMRFAIDYGYASDRVADWARGKGPSVMMIKGDAKAPAVLGASSPVEVGPMGKKIKTGLKVWPCNVGFVKEELYRWLNQNRPEDGEEFPNGYCHFPQYNLEYFEQITAEQLVTKSDRFGYKTAHWEKKRARNEALDVRVYNRIAACGWGLDRMADSHWAKLEALLGMHAARLAEADRSPNTVTESQPRTSVAAVPGPPVASAAKGRRTRFRFN